MKSYFAYIFSSYMIVIISMVITLLWLQLAFNKIKRIRKMMKKRSRRTITVSIAIISLGLLFYFFVQTFSDNLLFFRSPSQINQTEFPQGYIFRVGGMVKNESIERSRDSTLVNFVITDYSEEIKVNYKGILPDLFREGQGVVVRGFLNEDGTFTAEEVLAKHDETYMPPEVADSLQEKNTSYDQTTKSLRFD